MNIQTFLEINYPNYYSCNLIARLNDLYCIKDNEVKEGSAAEHILNNEFNGEINNNRMRINQYIATIEAEVYKTAIQNIK